MDDLQPFNLVACRDCEALERVKAYLKYNGIYYEASDYGNNADNKPMTYLNIYTTIDKASSIDNFLDSLPDESWSI